MLADYIEWKGIEKKEWCRKAGICESYVNGLISGHNSLTYSDAHLFAKLTKIPVYEWLGIKH